MKDFVIICDFKKEKNVDQIRIDGVLSYLKVNGYPLTSHA